VHLLCDPVLAHNMGERAREWVLQHRTYSAIADLVERTLLKVAQAGRAP
jgi:hypothetical protein